MARKKTPDVMGAVLGEKTPGYGSDPEATFQRTGIEETASKRIEALHIIDENVIWSMGAGFIPIPVVDLVAISSLQLRMLNALCELYEVKFSDHLGKSIIASLTGGIGSHSIASGAFGSLVKSIPLVGWIAGWFTMPIIAGATTYAIGKVFMQHFESGGTFLNFEAEEFKSCFREQYDKGVEVASRLKRSNPDVN